MIRSAGCSQMGMKARRGRKRGRDQNKGVDGRKRAVLEVTNLGFAEGELPASMCRRTAVVERPHALLRCGLEAQLQRGKHKLLPKPAPP